MKKLITVFAYCLFSSLLLSASDVLVTMRNQIRKKQTSTVTLYVFRLDTSPDLIHEVSKNSAGEVYCFLRHEFTGFIHFTRNDPAEMYRAIEERYNTCDV